jgi:4-amino-4-deoxy-L-arabinose transferase-like glycosyltransferase
MADAGAGGPERERQAGGGRPRERWPHLGGALVASLIAAALFLPGLGSVGLWDPWEPHYGEVAREMVERDDWVHPYWQEAHFFSKPVLLLWTGALGLEVAGVHSRALPSGADPADPSPGAVSAHAEWALRLPGALLAVLAVGMVYAAVARLASRRAAFFSALALATTPFYALLARQAIPDMPFVALSTAGAMAFAVALLDERARASAWAHAGYVLLAYATLAKGLLGFGLVAATFLAWLVVTGDWRRIGRLRLVERVGPLWLPLGPLVFLAIAAPWYTAMTLFPGRDDEGRTFAQRFWIHDHARRLGSGVHTTTPGGGFDYFLEQLGYGVFPWVAALPGALGELLRARPRSGDPRDGLALLCGIWAVVTYVLMSLSATKFHHYIFPAVPPLAILAGLFVDRLLRDGPGEHVPALLLGLAAYAVVGHGLWVRPKSFADLFVYRYDRPYPDRELAELHPVTRLGPLALSLQPRAVLGSLLAAGGASMLLGWMWRSGRWLAASLAGTAALLAAWLSWFHWRELSPHWTQRELFRTYVAERSSPDEPVVAYFMNWRGETFYGRNRVRQVMDDARMREIAGRPGRVWVVAEKTRHAALRSAVGPAQRLRVADRRSNKYELVAVEDAPDAPAAPPPTEPGPTRAGGPPE